MALILVNAKHHRNTAKENLTKWKSTWAMEETENERHVGKELSESASDKIEYDTPVPPLSCIGGDHALTC